MRFNIKTAILCEDVRQETGNKHSLMGVFSGDIVIYGKEPTELFVSFYLEMTGVPIGPKNLLIKISGPGDGSAKITAAAEVKSEGTMVLAGPKMALVLEKSGTFELAVGETEDDLEVVISKTVTFADPTSLPQPS